MNLNNQPIIPVSEARSQLTKLVSKAKENKIVLLSKSGKIKAALVDVDYLEKLQADLERLYGKTYIDPSLLPLTRQFSNSEIEQWLKEDQA